MALRASEDGMVLGAPEDEILCDKLISECIIIDEWIGDETGPPLEEAQDDYKKI